MNSKFLVLTILGGVALCRAQNVTVLQDVRLIDGTGSAPREGVSIVIEGTKIRDIVASHPAHWPSKARVLELNGRTVMPGIINGHGHLGLTQGVTSSPDNYNEANITRQLAQYQRYGVTTMISLGMNKDVLYRLIDEQKAGELDGATILTADRGMGVPDGVPPLKVGPDQVYRPSTPEEAREDVREMAARRPTLVKVWVDTNLGKLPQPNPSVYGAAIEEAHRQHLRVAAHVFYLADAKRLVADGVDILAHSVRDQDLDSELIDSLTKKRVYYIPTLQLEESFFIYAQHPAWMDSVFFRNGVSPDLWQRLNSPQYKNQIEADATTPIHRQALRLASSNVKKALDGGVKVAFGTDSGATPFRVQGFAEHRELELMVQAGFSPMQAIHAATEVNAEMLRISDHTGSIAKGKDADLLVLKADPSQDIKNTEALEFVFERGRSVQLQ